MTEIEMYLQFRHEIDRICVPEILKCVNTERIRYKGQLAGMLCYAGEDAWNYIDCLYIIRKFRRKGAAREAVLKWYESHNDKEIRLHIINRNNVAYAFWTSIFDIEALESNAVDTLYRVKGVKEQG